MRRDMATFSDRWRLVAQKSGAGKNIDYRFDALAEGRYAVVVEGQSPQQRSVSYLTLDRDEKKEQAVTLNDILLKGVVTLGDQPLAKASLTFSTDQELWSGDTHTNANGEYSVKLWQTGTWALTIDIPTERKPFFAIRHLNDDANQSWDIAIPTRAITGRVFDRRTTEAIPGAEVVDNVVPNTDGKIVCTTDQDGRFRLPMLHAGTHTIRVQSEGFVSSEPINVQLTEGDAERDVPIALDRGIRAFFRITNAAGEPVPNITVYDWVGLLGLENRAPYWSDAWGLVSIPLRQGEQKPIYVIDQSGSFSVAFADSATKTSAETPIKITLPPPVGVLTLLATTNSGPAAGVRFLVRFDGQFLPPRIWDLVTGSLSRVALTGQDGRLTIPSLPVGTYEFWPYQTVDDLRDVFRSVYTRAPTRLVLSPGPNTIKIDVNGAH
ncbi:MAG: carboxypeptidase regulatory-like domain-containing protein [Thermoanaerobaculia bacterium]